MVLFYELKLFSSTGTYLSPPGFAIATGKNVSFLAIFREACKDCKKKMASIPPSAFSSARIRESQRDMHISKIKNSKESEKYFNTKLMELTPLKYNSKLMNSIWGFYNRYSPHNVKKINDAISFNTELQQSAGNSSNKGDQVITLPTPSLDNGRLYPVVQGVRYTRARSAQGRQPSAEYFIKLNAIAHILVTTNTYAQN